MVSGTSLPDWKLYLKIDNPTIFYKLPPFKHFSSQLIFEVKCGNTSEDKIKITNSGQIARIEIMTGDQNSLKLYL